MNTYKFGAIDIGSNAIRLLIQNVTETASEPHFKKVSLIRVPVRLGEDSFLNNCISERNKSRLIDTMRGFSNLLQAHETLACIATATSAMRDADNGAEIRKIIAKKSGIDLNIIDGKQEADIIYSVHMERFLNVDKPYLFIDIGGGSTELTLLSKEGIQASHSFNIGTIRLLHNLVDEVEWNAMKTWVKENAKQVELEAIGSGGNVNRLYKMAGKSNWKPVSLSELRKLDVKLNALSYEERVLKLNLNTDRADVIIPAAKILTSVMKWAKIKNLNVPKMGLADGIIRRMYQSFKNSDTVLSHEVLNPRND